MSIATAVEIMLPAGGSAGTMAGRRPIRKAGRHTAGPTVVLYHFLRRGDV